MLANFKQRIDGFIPPRVIFATAQLALVSFLILSTFEVPQSEFLQGMLCGYSLVGNLYWLIKFSKELKNETN
jgi:hypothetical protein